MNNLKLAALIFTFVVSITCSIITIAESYYVFSNIYTENKENIEDYIFHSRMGTGFMYISILFWFLFVALNT